MMIHKLDYDIFDEFGIFDPVRAAKYWGMGCRFKGDGGGGPPSATMEDTETRKYARETLYPMVKSGLEGKGYGTLAFLQQRRKTLYGGLDESFTEAKSDLKSQMSRTIDPQDTRVRNYVTNMLSREYFGKKDEISRALRMEKVSDTDMSMAMAADYLAGEKRMSVSGAQMYNRALQQNIMDQEQMGTFGTNVAAGLGSSMADFYYAQKMGAA